jgi:hypothetical protein
MPAPVAPPKLSTEQKSALAEALVEGPRAVGYDTALWTGRRIAALIEKRFAVRYNTRYALHLLRTLRFTPQIPDKRAREKNEGEKAHWRRWQWPAIKKNRARHARLAGVYRRNRPAFQSSGARHLGAAGPHAHHRAGHGRA